MNLLSLTIGKPLARGWLSNHHLSNETAVRIIEFTTTLYGGESILNLTFSLEYILQDTLLDDAKRLAVQNYLDHLQANFATKCSLSDQEIIILAESLVFAKNRRRTLEILAE